MLFVTFLMLCLLKTNYCANILGVFMMPMVSHQTVFQPIWRELSLKGHKVTVITPNPLNDPRLTNLTEIDISLVHKIIKHGIVRAIRPKNQFILNFLHNTYNALGEFAKHVLMDPTVKSIIKDESKHFHLLLVEFVHPTMYALSAKFECPGIGITSSGPYIAGHDAFGNPSHPILNNNYFLSLSTPLAFWDRLYSVIFTILYRFYYAYDVLSKQNKIVKKHISDDLPYLGDIGRSTSMLFMNSDPINCLVRPNVQAIVELGYTRIKTNSSDLDLQKELDDAPQGVVYFSLGSNINCSTLPDELLQKIVQVFSELPYKVLWKWEVDNFANKPKNVVLRKWFPQQDVLGHKNIKVFVTQGGLQSMEEAISNSVPLVALPFFGDQPFNSAKMVKMGIAKVIDVSTLTTDELKQAILDVAEKETYRNAIKKISELTSDVPMTGLEKAVWWTEYVIRHKGARHLRSPAIDMPWHQYLLVDVICFVLAVLFVSIFVCYKVVRFTIGLLRQTGMSNKIKIS